MNDGRPLIGNPGACPIVYSSVADPNGGSYSERRGNVRKTMIRLRLLHGVLNEDRYIPTHSSHPLWIIAMAITKVIFIFMNVLKSVTRIMVTQAA